MTGSTPPERKPETPHDTPRSIASEALLDGSRELVILHGTERYRLRLTSTNKLILTK